ncbi:uncharacterized protein EI90DRAFT_712795 [Cantharellus anzutake]|uniref:uncharacterized protein n=1 Tax=Cantharellus anzutake TaxID=1750568 RepID=UPI0019060BF4|nr:uncharacterized protein EI90DRAFT_712795 [Cantharellus anzutake]KAF8332832.1 hypothetical protein EI90DRAFT_712795 [Cantharellus anzutake]
MIPEEPVTGLSTERMSWFGWHCSKCGKLTRRTHWLYWDCSGCGDKQQANHRIRSPAEFTNLRVELRNFPLFQYQMQEISGYQIETWILSENPSCILHRLRCPEPSPADTIFEAYQKNNQVAELFIRRELRSQTAQVSSVRIHNTTTSS